MSGQSPPEHVRLLKTEIINGLGGEIFKKVRDRAFADWPSADL
jgi:hypothetical protein